MSGLADIDQSRYVESSFAPSTTESNRRNSTSIEEDAKYGFGRSSVDNIDSSSGSYFPSSSFLTTSDSQDGASDMYEKVPTLRAVVDNKFPTHRQGEAKSSFSDFFAHPANRNLLWQFMIQEFHEEHMLFYQACVRYPESLDHLTAAKDIYSLYLHHSSVFYCQVPHAQQEKVQQAVEMGEPDMCLFDALQNSVVNLIERDSFSRFMTTETGRAAFGGVNFVSQTSVSGRFGIRLTRDGSCGKLGSVRTARQSEIVMRSFALASTDPGFSGALNQALHSSCPESESMFSITVHPASFVSAFIEALTLIRQNDVPSSRLFKRFAITHLRFGITINMIKCFGTALTNTVRTYLVNLNEDEAAAFDRHWCAVFDIIASQLTLAMTQLGPEPKTFFSTASEQDIPKWFQQQLGEYNLFAALTMSTIKKRGFDKFVVSFFTRFFELTPVSSEKFANVSKRAKCLLGGLNAVVKLLKRPKKMRRKMLKVVAVHQDKHISQEEYVSFVQALLATFAVELGAIYSRPVVLMWKQYLELLLLFLLQANSNDVRSFSSVHSLFSLPDLEVSTSLHNTSQFGGSLIGDFTTLATSNNTSSLEDESYGPSGSIRPGSFWDVMLTPSHFDLLLEFARDEFKEENLLFYRACCQFEAEKDSPENLETIAIKIYSLYLNPGSLFQVTVDSKEFKDVMQALGRQTVTVNLFDRVKKSIMKIIEKDTYLRFMSTPTGLALRGIQGNPIVSVNKNPRKLINNSNILRRSFQLATNSHTAFLPALQQELLELAPESQLLFQHSTAHQSRAVLDAIANLLGYLKNAKEKEMLNTVKSLADVHLSGGVTRTMFENFGKALLTTLLKFLDLTPHTLEYDVVSRHWQVLSDLFGSEIVIGMGVQLAKPTLFGKDDIFSPSLTKHFAEDKSFASLSLGLIKHKGGDEAFVKNVFAKLFSRSAISMKYFSGLAPQKKCLLGALNSVVSLLEHPKKARQLFIHVVKLHKGKGISKSEFVHYVQSVREVFQQMLGVDYTTKMDGVWKRGLDLFETFLIYQEGNSKDTSPQSSPGHSPNSSSRSIRSNNSDSSLPPLPRDYATSPYLFATMTEPGETGGGHRSNTSLSFFSRLDSENSVTSNDSFECCSSSHESFESVASTRLRALQKFAQDEYGDEHLLFFYVACTQYVERAYQQSQVEMIDSAQEIFHLFLEPAALFNVGLAPSQVKQIVSAIDNQTVHPELFEASKDSIVRVLERSDFFHRFVAGRHSNSPRHQAASSLSFSPTSISASTPSGSPRHGQKKVSDAEKRLSIQRSVILLRTSQLMLTVLTTNSNFLESFFIYLSVHAPETKLLFSDVSHQLPALRGFLSIMVLFSQQAQQQQSQISTSVALSYARKLKSIAELHCQLLITEEVLDVFGLAFTHSIKTHLDLFEKHNSEWLAIERHWHVAYHFVASDLLSTMQRALSDRENGDGSGRGGNFSFAKTPRWLCRHMEELMECTQQTIHFVKVTGEDQFLEKFYSKFFEFSPSSASKFLTGLHQKRAALGAIKGLSEMPLNHSFAKMCKVLQAIVKVHRGKEISANEFCLFGRALRIVFQSEIGDQYNEKFDMVWKQLIDFTIYMISEKKYSSRTYVPNISIATADEEETDDSEGESKQSDSSRASSRRNSLEDNQSGGSSGGGFSAYTFVPSVDVHGRLRMRSRVSDNRSSSNFASGDLNDETVQRVRILPREHEFLAHAFSDGKLTHVSNLYPFFQLLHKSPMTKRLHILNQYYMSNSYNSAVVLVEMLKHSSWKSWILPVCPMGADNGDAGTAHVRARLVEFVMLMLVEVFCFYFREFDESEGVIPKNQTRAAVVFAFERRGNTITMSDFLLDATAYISLLQPRDMVSRLLTAFLTKIGTWHGLRPSWTLPVVTEREWPNLFAALGAVEEFLFFSNRTSLMKEREFNLGKGPVFEELSVVEAVCKLLAKLKFERWSELPENNDPKLEKLQVLYQTKGKQEEIFFNGVKDFFVACAAGNGASALSAFVNLLMNRKQAYGSRAQIERVAVIFFEGSPPAVVQGLTKSRSLLLVPRASMT